MEHGNYLARRLPALPDGHAHGDGHGWMAALSGGWHEVASWGADGWDLGSWPYVVVAHYDGADELGLLFGRVVYVEGDLFVEGYRWRSERDKASSDTAVYYWRHYGNGPRDLPAEGDAPLYGPYTDTPLG